MADDRRRRAFASLQRSQREKRMGDLKRDGVFPEKPPSGRSRDVHSIEPLVPREEREPARETHSTDPLVPRGRESRLGPPPAREQPPPPRPRGGQYEEERPRFELEIGEAVIEPTPPRTSLQRGHREGPNRTRVQYEDGSSITVDDPEGDDFDDFDEQPRRRR